MFAHRGVFFPGFRGGQLERRSTSRECPEWHGPAEAEGAPESRRHSLQNLHGLPVQVETEVRTLKFDDTGLFLLALGSAGAPTPEPVTIRDIHNVDADSRGVLQAGTKSGSIHVLEARRLTKHIKKGPSKRQIQEGYCAGVQDAICNKPCSGLHHGRSRLHFAPQLTVMAGNRCQHAEVQVQGTAGARRL